MAVVSATNGKTTTARMLSAMLRAWGREPVHNRAGANLLTGLASALVAATDARGRVRLSAGLFEVDEATLPRALEELSPRVLVLMNLFRDQLDRFGELETLASAWHAAIRRLPPTTHLVLNADDPLIARLADVAPGPVDLFGIDDTAAGIGRADHAADSGICRCGHALAYRRVFYGHIGLYRCSGCGWERPRPTVRATAVRPLGLEGVRAEIDLDGESRDVHLRLPGLYNVYNALAAAAGALAFGVPLPIVVDGLELFRAAFGRLERVDAGGRQIVLWLVKNPAGFNESLRTLFDAPGDKAIAIFINDRIADGLDVSWLWDVDFEMLDARRSELAWLLVGGTRGDDMAMRLKYAGLDASTVGRARTVEEGIEKMRMAAPAGVPVYCFATYTAMLELRGRLERLGFATPLRDE